MGRTEVSQGVPRSLAPGAEDTRRLADPGCAVPIHPIEPASDPEPAPGPVIRAERAVGYREGKRRAETKDQDEDRAVRERSQKIFNKY